MNISKEDFIKLVDKHLIPFEGYNRDKNGNFLLEIGGSEKLYEAICLIEQALDKTSDTKKMITEKNFLEAGFVKDDSPVFLYRKELVPTEEIKDNDLGEEEVPCLFFGDTGVNKGFCIFTGAHFVFFDASSPKEAVEWAKKITAFEPIY